MNNREVINAMSISDALLWMKRLPNSVVIAGGTDIIPKLQKTPNYKPWIYIGHAEDLSYISEAEDHVEIGACTCLAEIAKNETVKERCPLLAQAIDNMASPQVRNRGTLGGNIANASPAGDALTALYALRAIIVCAELQDSTIAENKIEINRFVKGPGVVDLAPGQLITKIIVPFQNGRHVFEKIGGRRAIAVSIGSVAIIWAKKNNMPFVRISVGACAKTPIVCEFPFDEGDEGANISGEIIADTVCGFLTPISDIRAPAEYRKDLIRSILKYYLRGDEKKCD